MMKVFLRTLVTLVLLAGIHSEVCASWLSDAVGINIDIPKLVSPAPPEPATRAVVVALPQPIPPVQTAIEVRVVKPADKALLTDRLHKYYDTSAALASRYSGLSLGVIVLSILAGVVSSIASFLKKSTMAGIVAILGASVIALGNALPINEYADYYESLSLQSLRLWELADLETNMTLDNYEVYRKGLDSLLTSAGTNAPKRKGSEQRFEDVLGKLRNPTAITQSATR